MSIFIANIGNKKDSWSQVSRIINNQDWSKIIIITNELSKDNFKAIKEVEYIIINSLKESITKIIFKLKKRFNQININEEIYLNLISGNGKEHMAILLALKESKKDYKLITLTGDGIYEI